jgi:3D (Asp-Asp-Asp) domain-containing protein
MSDQSYTVAIGARARRRATLVVKLAAVTLATAGAWTGLFAAEPSAPPLVMIGDATTTMNEGFDANVVDDAMHDAAASPVGDDSAVERAAASFINEDDTENRWFNGRPIRPARVMSMTVTAYSPDKRSCGRHADGITASGYSVWTNGMKLVAADTNLLPLGSLVSIPGYDGDRVVPVLDRGGKIKGRRLDVLYPSHETALQWGVQRLDVTVWEYADGKPNGFRERHRR